MRDQVARERARLLRQVGRLAEARQAWRDLAMRNGPLSAIAWIELAKVLEHVDRDFDGALEAVGCAERMAEQSALVGRLLPLLEADLVRRRPRLVRRKASRNGRAALPRSAAAAQALPHAVANG
jgi:hypothetical protein